MEPAGEKEARETQDDLTKNHNKRAEINWLLLGGREGNSSEPATFQSFYRSCLLLVEVKGLHHRNHVSLFAENLS